MKDIKTFLIGFLTCACLFLIMGQTKSDNQNGRYQATATITISNKQIVTIVDTRTGEIVKYFKKHSTGIKNNKP